MLTQDNTPGRAAPDKSREELGAVGREEDRVHGIRRFLVPIEITSFGGAKFSGEDCYSPDYDPHLYQVLDTAVRESGLTARIRTEPYDFQLGTAAAADKIRLPGGFVVQETRCEACTAEP